MKFHNIIWDGDEYYSVEEEIETDYKMKEFLVIKCLNCGLYLVDNDKDSQIDCPYCGYSNELTDIRVEWWEVEEKK